jgi:hypothetical protein
LRRRQPDAGSIGTGKLAVTLAVALLLTSWPADANGQVFDESAVLPTVAFTNSIRSDLGEPASQRTGSFRPGPHGWCCNKKGAIIGLAIGAGLGAWLVRSTCDAGSCTGAYFKAMGVLGGLGAGFGALVHPARGFTPLSRFPGIGVTPAFSSQGAAVFVEWDR